MSAYDLAGAFIWTPMAVGALALAAHLFQGSVKKGWEDGDTGGLLLFSVPTLGLIGASVFCIARLCGAHA